MLTRTTSKGNKTQDKGIIPFYTTEVFSDTKSIAEDNNDTKKPTKVTIHLKLDESQPPNRDNCFEQTVKQIENFHLKGENIENIMEIIIAFIKEEILTHITSTSDYQKIMKFQQYIKIVLSPMANHQWKEMQINAKLDITKPCVQCSDTVVLRAQATHAKRVMTIVTCFCHITQASVLDSFKRPKSIRFIDPIRVQCPHKNHLLMYFIIHRCPPIHVYKRHKLLSLV